MIHFPNHGKGPKDKQINGSLDDIWPRASTGPAVFGMNVNVKSAVFFMCSEAGQSYNTWHFVLINVAQFQHLKQLVAVLKLSAAAEC